MNLLDFAVTPLWLVWDAVRDLAAEDGVLLAESELIGLAPQASFEAIADHTGATGEVARRSARGRSRLPPPARLLTDADPRTSARGGQAQRRSGLRRRAARDMTGGPFRVIEGGRTGEPTPGLLIVGASEIVTLAGGVRRGPRQGDLARLVADEPGSASSPVVAVLGGKDRRRR